jgi:hypothetical protein
MKIMYNIERITNRIILTAEILKVSFPNMLAKVPIPPLIITLAIALKNKVSQFLNV